MLKSLSKLTNGEKMNASEAIKIGAGLAISIGADIAVSALFGQHLPFGSKGIKNLLAKLGVAVLAMKVGEDAETYFYKIFDDTKEALAEVKKEAEKAAEEVNHES